MINQKRKIKKSRSWFLEKVRKIVKPPDRLRKKKRERRERANIRNERSNLYRSHRHEKDNKGIL